MEENAVIKENMTIEENAVIELKQQPFKMQTISYPVTEEILQAAEKKYAVVPEDLSDKENYKFVKTGISIVGKMGTQVENRRKELNRDALDYMSGNNSKAKTLKNRLVAIRQPMKDKKTTFDTAEEIKKREVERKEEERQDKIELGMERLRSIVSQHIMSGSTQLQEIKEGIEIDDLKWAEERTEKAEELKADALARMAELLKMKLQTENAEKAEEEREQQERIRQKEQTEKNARVAEENKKQADELAAAQKKLKDDQESIEEKQRGLELAESRRKIALKAAEDKRILTERADLEQREQEARIKLLREKEEKERQEKEIEDKRVAAEKEIEDKRIAAEKEIEDKRIAKEKAEHAKKTLAADIKATEMELSEFCNKENAKALLAEIIQNNFKHLKWI